MKRILIVGAGGHAQVIADAVLSCARAGEAMQLAGFLDDNSDLVGCEVLGSQVLGTLSQIGQFEHEAVVVGIGDNALRRRLFERLKQQGEQFITVIHPRATLAAQVQLGHGCVVFAGAVINTGAIMGDNVIVNTGVTVDHHARIGSHGHMAPGVHLGGAVTLGEGVFLGIGVNVIPQCTVGEWAVVGAGAAVIHDVPARVTVAGVPARPIK